MAAQMPKPICGQPSREPAAASASPPVSARADAAGHVLDYELVLEDEFDAL